MVVNKITTILLETNSQPSQDCIFQFLFGVGSTVLVSIFRKREIIQLFLFSYDKSADSDLTCFAIPKSANFTRPLGSTNIFAPLMSLKRN